MSFIEFLLGLAKLAGGTSEAALHTSMHTYIHTYIRSPPSQQIPRFADVTDPMIWHLSDLRVARRDAWSVGVFSGFLRVE